jgi:hypothetical protein
MFAPALKRVGDLIVNDAGSFMVPFSEQMVIRAMERNIRRPQAPF